MIPIDSGNLHALLIACGIVATAWGLVWLFR
jgi:hypothetical protein